jgi:ribose-phosphate pyrophosphokinase
MNMGKIIFSTRSAIELASKVAKKMGSKIGKVKFDHFPDGEMYVRVLENVKGKKVFLFASITVPSDNIMEYVLLANALKHAHAHVTGVITYVGYARQDRVSHPGEPVSIQPISELLERSVDKIILVDPHDHKAMRFFKKRKVIRPFELLASVVKNFKDVTLAGPDVPSFERAQEVGKLLKNPHVMFFFKHRKTGNEVKTFSDIKRLKTKNAFIMDDIISTGHTILNAAKILRNTGAENVYVMATHGVFAGDALERMSRSPDIKKIFITDTIKQKKHSKKLKIISMADTIAKELK